jgi:hypothetical protein
MKTIEEAELIELNARIANNPAAARELAIIQRAAKYNITPKLAKKELETIYGKIANKA